MLEIGQFVLLHVCSVVCCVRACLCRYRPVLEIGQFVLLHVCSVLCCVRA